MKRINFTTRSNPHFIGAWNILDDDICKKIIDFFENNPDLQKKVAQQSWELMRK